MKSILGALLIFCFTRCTLQQQGSCTRQDYEKCVKIADPLMKDAHLIFPDNMADIDLVCRRWSQFVDCVKRYTDKCFTETRKQDFNKAIAQPVDSVHQMCTDSSYQKEYLQYATCIKSTLLADEHCGRHYKHLVEQVSGGEVSRVTLCCSHHRFRECVLDETKRECDSGKDGGPAARFSKQILDKALSFIRDQCNNYIPSAGYCPGTSIPSSNRVDNAAPDQQWPAGSLPRTTGADKRVTNPWLPSTNTRTTEDRAGRDKWTQTNVDNKQASSSSSAWLPTTQTTPLTLFHPAINTTMLTLSDPMNDTRPSSYGRGMSYTTPTSVGNTEPADWLTKTWKVTSQDDSKHKTDTWRPNVAGFGAGLHNQVDEPNQQGLANKNRAPSCGGNANLYLLVCVITVLCKAM